jgi:hypothetical protein
VTRAYSERFFFLRVRLVVLAALTTVLALYSFEIGLVGVMGAVLAAATCIWLIGVWRMVRLLGVGRAELRSFHPIAWIAVAAAAGAAAAAVVRATVVGGPGWYVILASGAAFAAVYAAGLRLSGVIAGAEMVGLWRDLCRTSSGAGAILVALRRRPRPQGPSDPSAPAPGDLLPRQTLVAEPHGQAKRLTADATLP